MKEIKINVSPKVWIYLLLVMIAVFAVIMGVSAAIGGSHSQYLNRKSIITMLS